MSSTQARLPEAPRANGRAASIAAAIDELPSFIRAPIFMPTERMAAADAIAGLARVRALYEYDLDLTHRPRLRALKAARARRRCFIIGNGPSLARTDLGKLANEVTFATNGFFLKMGELDWSPTYYVVEDHLVGEDRAAELTALTGTTKLFPASLAYALPPDEHTIYFDHRPRISYPDGFDFSFDADVNTYTGGTVTFTCMQLAAYLGFQEIYLIGVDADYSIPADATLSGAGRVKEIDMRSDDPNHFHPDYFGKGRRWHEPNVDVMLGAYAEARRATESRGISIVNATVGGKLEVFPRVDFEMLFRPAPVERLLVIDHTRIGDGTATGEVKATLLGDWPPDRVMQLYDRGHGRLRIAGGPTEVDDTSLAGQVAGFDPDLIFYRPVPRKDGLHDAAMEVIARTNLPLALWIVDDWPSAYAREEPEAARQLDADLRWLLTRADVRFSISPAMSAAFHERYGLPFVPIANGVDPADWPPAELRSPSHITVRYAGGLPENMTLASVGLVARMVEQLAERGLDISFEIKTHRHWRTASAAWMAELKHTAISTSDLPRPEYRRWLADADILLIAYNFDARSRDYIRYSLANKLPECLASGSAILAVGPDDIGTIATMAALDVGERVTTDDDEVIGETLRRLAGSPERRFEMAKRGQAVAFSLFGVAPTRQAFDAAVGRIAAAHRAGDYPRDLQAHVDETAAIASLLSERRGADHVLVDVGGQRSSSTNPFDGIGWTVHGIDLDRERRAPMAAWFAGVVGELGLTRLDVLRVDADGLALEVLRGVPWGRLQPDVVACDFTGDGSSSLRHSWREIGAYLRDRGYTAFVSEWHPLTGDGRRPDWRRLVPFTNELDVDRAAWGRVLAFREDPGWQVLRRSFDRLLERGAGRPAEPPLRTRSADGMTSVESENRVGGQADGVRGARAAEAPVAQSLKRKAPAVHGMLRLIRRVAAHLWIRKRWTVPFAVLFISWALVGFVPAFASAAPWIWGSAAVVAVGLATLYAVSRVYASLLALRRSTNRLLRSQRAQGRKLLAAEERLRRLERSLGDGARTDADLARRLARLEASIERLTRELSSRQ